MGVIRQIAQIGHPVLRQVASPVEDTAHPLVHSLVEDMLLTVDEEGGVGIAAPQVFESLSLFILCPRPNARYPHAPAIDPIIMMNAEIVRRSDETDLGWEGCLSIPGIRGLVPRHRRITASFTDLSGERREVELEGFPARVFQHENDHVNGILFLDRADPRHLASEKEYLRLISSVQHQN